MKNIDRIRRFAAALTLLITSQSCTGLLPELTFPDTDTEDSGKTQVNIRIRNAYSTRSLVSPDTDKIHDINIYAYRDGILDSSIYTNNATSTTLWLNIGYSYNIYAIANTGEITAPSREEDITALVWRIEEISDLSRKTPMAGRMEAILVKADEKSIEMTLERLISRITLTLDERLLNGLQVTAVRLHQSPSAVRPFAENGSRAENTGETIDGDSATEEDLEKLNSGEGITFYTLENCQGQLLPENTDPWAKVPDAIGNRSAVCTYMEIECRFEETSSFWGKVVYRIFPGNDNITDFSIIRNTDMNITLYPTMVGLARTSWKVTAERAYKSALLQGWIEKGHHPLSDLYVGETFLIKADVCSLLFKHLGNTLEGCSIRMVSEDSGNIGFSSFEASSESGQLQVWGKCLASGSGTLWLYSPEGEKAALLGSGVCINNPNITLSEHETIDPQNTGFGLDHQKSCTINGGGTKIHAYLTDKEGYNLNTDYWSGFDLSVFELKEFPETTSDFQIRHNILSEASLGTSCSNGPAATYTIWCRNDGKDEEVNIELCSALSSTEAFRIRISDKSSTNSVDVGMGLDFKPIGLTLVDNRWAGYHASHTSLKVNNPSNLPLRIDAWQANRPNNDWNSIFRNEIIDEVENSMKIDRINYITDSFYQSQAPLYGHGTVIYCERNGSGDTYTAEGETMVYPLTGMSVETVHKVLAYDKQNQDALYHLFHIQMPANTIGKDKVSIADSLSNGSMKYNIIYGNDPENPGWNNQGIWLYSDSGLLAEGEGSLADYPGLTPRGLYEMTQDFSKSKIMNINLSYSKDDGILYAIAEGGNPSGITIDVEISGTVKGYVKTYPNGTMGSAQDNNCSTTFSRSITGLSIGAANISFDSGAIKEAMDVIYNKKYTDSNNWIGSANSYQHRAHPTAISLEIKLKTSSDSQGLYPVKVTWNASSLPYYHAQDEKTYNATLEYRTPAFSFVNITSFP